MDITAAHFPDAQHVEAVQRALWADRAAVMVGAGMSRNAEPRRAGGATMPVWSDLARLLIDRLYPPGRAADRHREALRGQASATSAALRLAEEFAVTFGRPALDDLILEATPDGEFAPGGLHRSLLELPWADVLTTNYDTLLERAAAEGLGQRYSVVRCPEEIPGAARPRIVKLHGSLPSNRPFVLTEEDFRTYPRKFAPFVNLAQQAVMENAVCLLGFSGDDPNFLYWTGWVRDHLGGHAPNVYLCGLLELSGSQRLLLNARNVTPIDLSPLFPRDRHPDAAARNREALGWLLRTLAAGRPYSPLEWPTPPRGAAAGVGHLVSGVSAAGSTPVEEPRKPPDRATSKAATPEQIVDGLLEVITLWRHNRSVYPGWLVAPSGVRHNLWFNTVRWPEHVLVTLPHMTPTQRLEALSELNWRLETALLPIWSSLLPAYQQALEAVNPSPEDVTDLPAATLTLTATTSAEHDWAAIRRRWLELAFGLLRSHREERQAGPFEQWSRRVNRISDLDGDARARLCYERCLFALGNSDDQSACDRMAEWPQDARDPFWAVRRAAVLAEVGRAGEALVVAEGALGRLQTGNQGRIPELSREGWALSLVLALRRNADIFASGSVADNLAERAAARGRYRQLAPHGCSPEEITDYLESRLDQPVPCEEPQGEVTAAFQPGAATRSTHSGGQVFGKLLPAYQYLRLTEEAARPPQFGVVSIGKETLLRVAEWFAEHDAVRTTSLMFRLGEEKLVNGYLSRHRVAALPVEVVAGMMASARRAIDQAVSNLADKFPRTDRGERAESLLKTGADILARLLTRNGDEALSDSWLLAATIYKNPKVAASVSGYEHVKQLYKSLIATSSPAEVERRVLELLLLPLPGEPDFAVRMADHWPEPSEMAIDALGRPALKFAGHEWKAVKARLFHLTSTALRYLKVLAFTRLYVLAVNSALTGKECRKLGRVYWAEELNEYGLPSAAWGLSTSWFALHLPPPAGAKPIDRVKASLLSAPTANVHEGIVWTEVTLRLFLKVTALPHLRGDDAPGRLIDWTAEEADRLFTIVEAWWAAHACEVADPADSVAFARRLFGGTSDEHLSLLCDVVRTVILPRVRGRRKLTPRILSWIEQVRTAKLPVGSVLPATLWLRPGGVGEVASGLRGSSPTQGGNSSCPPSGASSSGSSPAPRRLRSASPAYLACRPTSSGRWGRPWRSAGLTRWPSLSTPRTTFCAGSGQTLTRSSFSRCWWGSNTCSENLPTGKRRGSAGAFGTRTCRACDNSRPDWRGACPSTARPTPLPLGRGWRRPQTTPCQKCGGPPRRLRRGARSSAVESLRSIDHAVRGNTHYLVAPRPRSANIR